MRLAAAAALLCIFSTPAMAVTWQLTPDGSPVTESGNLFINSLEFLTDERLLVASAWSESGNQQRFGGGRVRLDPTGLGACSWREGFDCFRSGTPLPVDNNGTREYLLLQLDGDFNFESALVDLAGGLPSGFSYWVGSIPTDTSLNRVTYGDLASLGFGPQQDVVDVNGAANTRITLEGRGNALLIGADRYGNSDAFFLNALTASPVVVPLPPSVVLFATALLLLGSLRKRLRTDAPLASLPA